MQLFFDGNINNLEVFKLNEKEAYHLIKVLRAKIGTKINITNGLGDLFYTEIIEIGKKNVTVKILTKEYFKEQKNYKLHIAIAPTKSIDRFEWFVEKAVEIGIDRITPIITRYSERKIIKKERTEKVIISAMKQSLKYHKPILDDVTDFSTFIKNTKTKNRFIAYCSTNNTLKNFKLEKENLFIIGPEGGFADFEYKLAIEKEFKPLKINNFRLRTETAGAFVASALNTISNLI